MAANIRASQTTTLLLDADGDGVIDPGDTVLTSVLIQNTGDQAATNVTLTEVLVGMTSTGNVNVSPLAGNDAFAAIGNTVLDTGGTAGPGPELTISGNVLANDQEFLGDGSLHITSFQAVSAQGGAVVVNMTNGTFTYDPLTGFTGTDTFTYTVTDNGLDGLVGGGDDLSSTATVTLTVSNRVWYVDAAAAGGGDGSSNSAFTTLAQAEAASAVNDIIYVREAAGDYGPITLKNGQQLIGSGVDLVVGGNTLIAASSDATLSSAGVAVTLAQNNTIRGISIGDSTTDISGSNFGTLSIDNVTLSGTGQALNLTNGAFAAGASFDSVSSTSGTSNISLTTVTGSVDLGSGALSGATGAAFNISGGTVSTTYAGSIANTSTGSAVNVSSGHATGTMAFSGTINGSGTGLQFSNADGTYNFTGSTTLNGDSAGIDIVAGTDFVTGSTGTFSFGSSTSITHNALGDAFTLTGSDANVTYSGSINDANGRAVFIDDHDSGTVTFQTGSITSSGASAQGIAVINSGGGSVNFNGQTTLSTTSSSAVSMTVGNAGGTVNFNPTGGGLDITTSSGTGFVATGGGTVTVTGSGNTINSGLGTALNIANTTIGANDVTFQSISANGAVNGIVLNNTGSNGGLTVTGDANAALGGNNSGGTIQNTTGDGISLTNTRDVSLTNMNIQTTGDHGIDGTGVTNFTFANGKINNAGNASGENSINFDPDSGTANVTFLNNVSGVVSITNNQITNTEADGVRIYNGFGTISNLAITGNQLSDTGDVATPGSAILVRANAAAVGSAASVTRADLNNNTITDFRAGNGFTIQAVSTDATNSAFVNLGTPGSATNIINVTGNLMNGGNGGIGNQPDRFITAGIAGTAAANFNISNNGTAANPITNIDGVVIEVQADGHSTYTATVNNNRIVANNAVGSAGIAIGADADGFASTTDDAFMTATVSGNNISQTDGVGIFGLARGTSTARLDIHILNNTVAAPSTTNSARAGIRVDSGSASSIDTTVNLQISGNTTAGSTNSGTATTSPGINLRKQGTDPSINEFHIQGLNPSPTGTPNVENHVNSLNTSASGTFGVGGTALLSATSGFTTTGPFLLAGSGGVEADDSAHGEDSAPDPIGDPVIILPPTVDPLIFDAPPPVIAEPPSTESSSPIIDDGVLSQAELAFLVDAAIARWNDSGLSAEQITALEGIDFSVAALGPRHLGQFTSGAITLDDDGAGLGWFLDATPLDDAEFANGIGTRITAASGSAPAGRYDLLTTLMHEMGHALGLSDSYAESDRDDLMFGWLFAGERRLAGQGDAIGAVAGAITEEEFLTAPVNVGTLGPGQQVTVQWTATVDPQTNKLITNPVNQGTVTADGGISTQTDADGDTANGNQANITALDTLVLGDFIFNDLNGNGGFDTGEGISGVTLTLWADNNVVGGDNDFDPGAGAGFDTIVATTTSGPDGYSFTGLAPGNYIVQVNQSNFNGGGVLEFLKASVPGAVDPDNNSDTDENGFAVTGQGHATGVITLSYNSEPMAGTGNDTNNTLDIGVLSSAPVITVSGGSAAFTEGADVASTPVAVDPGLTLTDADSATLTLATARITGNFAAGEDVLGFINNNAALYGNITGSFVGDMLTLSSATSATVAQFQNALRAVTYTNISDTPSTLTRTIAFSATDPDDTDSSPQQRQITIAASNDSPVNAVPGGQSVNEDSALVFSAATFNAISVLDPDVDPVNDVITVTLSVPVGAGALQVRDDVVGGLAAGDIAGNGAISVTLTGTQNAINNTLTASNGVTYTPAGDLNGGVNLTIATDDQGFTGGGGAKTDSDNIPITIAPQNDAPNLSGLNANPTFVEDGAAVLLDGDASLSDIDLNALNGGSGNYAGSSLTVARNGGANTADNFAFIAGALFTVSGGNLQSGGLTFATFASVAGTLTVNFTSSGTAATAALVDDVLTRITYSNSNNAPPANVTLDYVFNDGSPGNNQGAGGAATTATGSITVNITPTNDAPTDITGALAVNEYTPVGTAVGTVVGVDVDGPGGLTYALIDSAGGRFAMNSAGQVTVANGYLLDFEQAATHMITVQANDGTPGGTFSKQLTVTVNNVDPDNTFGTSAEETFFGGALADLLNGGGGGDTLRGGGGNDLYVLDHAGDQVVETAGGGNADQIFANFNYTLANSVEVEVLNTYGTASTGDIKLTGNNKINTLLGNTGANTLNGGGAADILRGFGGNDVYIIDDSGDQVLETVNNGTDELYANVNFTLAAGQHVELMNTFGSASTNNMNLTGNELAQTIRGNAGSNVINGGLGNDALRGFGGADFFLFNTAIKPAANIDTIADFSVIDDTIQLDDAIFTGLAVGALAAGAFNTGSAATQADDRVIYNTATGALLFDADGLNGAAGVQFATLTAGLGLGSNDFIIV